MPQVYDVGTNGERPKIPTDPNHVKQKDDRGWRTENEAGHRGRLGVCKHVFHHGSFHNEQYMFSDDSQGCFDERPQHETEPSVFCLLSPFVAEIIERLLHGLFKLLSEPARIAAEEFFVKNMVTTQGKGVTKSGKKGAPVNARRKAVRACTPFFRAVDR